MRRVFLLLAVVAVCLAQTSTPPAISAYFRLAGNSTGPYPYQWLQIDPPLSLSFDGKSPHLSVNGAIGPTGPQGLPGNPGTSAPSQPRICSFGIGDGVNALPAAWYPSTSSYYMGCPNNTATPWTVTAIHCWTDNNGLSSTVDVFNNAGVSYLLMPVACTSATAGGGVAGSLANAPPNIPASFANTTLAPGDAFSFQFHSDGITTVVRVTVDYQ